ncbi:hypothetical protein BJ165DRAFT_569900 [Panaeolus papilionaceus]|nr:hypothetical protein BJ165DRAFT_569900 [Panaeolus papilionaceus]
MVETCWWTRTLIHCHHRLLCLLSLISQVPARCLSGMELLGSSGVVCACLNTCVSGPIVLGVSAQRRFVNVVGFLKQCNTSYYVLVMHTAWGFIFCYP